MKNTQVIAERIADRIVKELDIWTELKENMIKIVTEELHSETILDQSVGVYFAYAEGLPHPSLRDRILSGEVFKGKEFRDDALQLQSEGVVFEIRNSNDILDMWYSMEMMFGMDGDMEYRIVTGSAVVEGT